MASKVMTSKILDSKAISWKEFQAQMTTLAEARTTINQSTIIKRGLQYLRQLDLHSTDFKLAVKESYETGNRYWLWQRMIKENNINGGILNINSEQPVQLHDHPGAIGMVRIISGETEVWQFDIHKGNQIVNEENIVDLVRVSHSVLRAGDIAVLTPQKGNIHALRAISKQCRMLDFFIPPYQQSQRSWYEPLTNNWVDKKQISCRKIPQHTYSKA